MLGRVRALLPRTWFADASPIRDALLAGIAYTKSFLFGLIQYTALQTRIKTATDGWLDMIAADFFGAGLMRKAGQSDTSYRNLIITSLFRERATRAGLAKVLIDLTGRPPLIFEPLRVADTGAYCGPACGYGVAGGYGSMLLPYQSFVTAYRPSGTGIPNVAGYGVPAGGYSVAAQSEWAALSMVRGEVTDADIYAAIDSVKPAGTIIWTRISN